MHDWFFRLDRQTGSSFYITDNLAIDETQINRYLTDPGAAGYDWPRIL
jgi:hypothetical protein